jgi:formate-dependent nitrite reductase membrane component NrfD
LRDLRKLYSRARRSDRTTTIIFVLATIMSGLCFVLSATAPDRFSGLLFILSIGAMSAGAIGIVCLMSDTPSPPPRRSRTASRPSYRRIGH